MQSLLTAGCTTWSAGMLVCVTCGWVVSMTSRDVGWCACSGITSTGAPCSRVAVTVGGFKAPVKNHERSSRNLMGSPRLPFTFASVANVSFEVADAWQRTQYKPKPALKTAKGAAKLLG